MYPRCSYFKSHLNVNLEVSSGKHLSMLLSKPNRVPGNSGFSVRNCTNRVRTYRNGHFEVYAISGADNNTRRDILRDGSLLGGSLLVPSSLYSMLEPGPALAAEPINGAYSFEAEYRGETFLFNQFQGKVTVFVNTASE